jgi:mono/diheme cytochrome c family protein
MRLTRLLSLAVVLSGAAAEAAEPQAVEFFEKNVRPLLAQKCWACHGQKKQQGGLRLDSRVALLKGSDSGPVVIAGQPDKSLLIRAVRREGDTPMPPKGALTAGEIDSLAAWVRLGLPWPDPGTAATTSTVEDARRRHWAFRPVRKPALPAVRDAAWVRTPIDAFVRAGLEAKGLAPAPPADRVTLIRRLSFDLIGLPPTPEEVDAFLADPSSRAYEKLVDRLLASPHYGERWGRHWLDVARYADTKGYVFTEERRYPYAYTYRDWVIRAFNEDLPYDRFLVQQLAADLLPLGDDKRPLAAMGFLTLGRRFLNNQPDIIDDRIDVIMRGLQGLTVACARCHDHKFDPIPQRDYYSLYGVFASSVEPKELPPLPAPMTPERATFEAELKKRTDAVEQFRAAHKAELAAGNRKFRDELKKLEKKAEEWRATAPGSPPRAMVLQDLPSPMTPHVFLRGNPNNPGPAVPRQFLEVLAGPSRQPFAQGSGRLELARAIASKDNPLTARVLVNRLWQHHFGQGLVRTPGNFGLRGEPPTHPQLLDWLAATFVEEGWSIKKLHRLILLSNTYRQASVADSRTVEADPENRLWGRMNRRRLEFEPLRDALLAAAGRLDPTAGGKAVELTTAPYATRRSVYGFIDRQNLPGLFRTFDFASPDASTPERHATTVPQQALFLMNSPFVVEQARHFAARPDVKDQPGDEARIRRMHRIAYGREAEPEEVALGLRFVAAAKAETGRLGPWEQYAQVLLLANEFAMVD